METQDFLLDLFKSTLSPKGKLLGIDYGMKRIGLAVSDEQKKTASPLLIIHKLNELDALIPKHDIVGCVIGYPLQPDGTEGDIIHQVMLFGNRVSTKYHLPVLYVDERLSSVSVEKKMSNDTFISYKHLQKNLDAYVAAHLLEQVLKRF